jgi:organic radical activating enzyme
MEIVKFYEKGSRPNQLIVQWNLGNICNYQCEYCPSILHRGDRPWVEFPLIAHTISKLKTQFPYKTLRFEFLGGEITLYRDFIELMKFCKEQELNSMIFSNASRTFRHWKEVSPYLDEVLLTFHPHSTDKEHFKTVMKLCLDAGVTFYVHLAMTKDLFWDTAEYAQNLQNEFPKTPISMTLMMDKEKQRNFNGFFYNYSQEEINFIKKYDKGSEQYIAEFDTGDMIEYSLNDVKTLGLNKFKNFQCGSQESIININSLGIATSSLCRQKSKINIYTDKLDPLFTPHTCTSAVCENPGDLRILKRL